MSVVNAVTFTLVIVGALNWGLVGIARFDLVATLFGMSFGQVSGITSVLYTAVGLSALYQAFFFKNAITAGVRR